MEQEQDRIEGNKIIAEFMGWRFIKWCEEKLPLYQRFENDKLVHDGIFHAPEFHNQWDSLMPVVEKIENLNKNYYSQVSGEINLYDCEISDVTIEKPLAYSQVHTTKIEAVWLAVVEFIKWYNQNK